MSVRKYYDGWQDAEFECPACHWHGPGSALVLGDYNWESAERLCPACKECLVIVMHPTFEESRANWDKVSEWDRRNIEAAEAHQAEFALRKLRDHSQLPEIGEASFVLHWDFVDNGQRKDTVIKHRDNVIFSETALYEGYKRFIEVAENVTTVLHRDQAILPVVIPSAARNLTRLCLCHAIHRCDARDGLRGPSLRSG